MSSETDLPLTAPQVFDRTVADLKDGVASATNAYKDISEKAAKTTTVMTEFGKGTMEACVQAGQIYAAEAQDLFRQMTAAGQTAIAESLSGYRALVAAKTAKERLELQATLSRTAAVWAVSEYARFARAGIDMVEKVSAPVAARVYLAADKFGTFQA